MCFDQIVKFFKVSESVALLCSRKSLGMPYVVVCKGEEVALFSESLSTDRVNKFCIDKLLSALSFFLLTAVLHFSGFSFLCNGVHYLAPPLLLDCA